MSTNRRGLFKRLVALALAPVESIRAALPVPKKKITPYVFPTASLDQHFVSDAARISGMSVEEYKRRWNDAPFVKKDPLYDGIGFNFSTIIRRK